MCNNPHTVFVRRKNGENYTKSLHQSIFFQKGTKARDIMNDRLKPYFSIDAPCGKCAECLRKKQKCVEVRFLRESEVNPLMFFVTLTYRQEKMPMATSLWVVDRDTGEQYLQSTCSVVSPRFNKTSLDSPLEVTRRELLGSMKTTFNPDGVEFLEKTIFDLDGMQYVLRAAPSLCRHDVKLWIKRCRMRYERKFGEKVADFRYYICGEYGFSTQRPHYHIAFFGLPQRQLDFFLQHWKESFGFVYCEKVYARNKDGSNAFLLVGKYVAKYMTKLQDHEHSGVVDRYVEKPRVMSSKSFGVGKVSEALRNYYLGFRFFGEYDVETLRLKDGKRLSQEQIDYLSQYIAEHLYFDVDGFLFPIPGLVRKRLFGIYRTKVVNHEIKEYFYAFSPIYYMAMEYARSVYMDTLERKLAAGSVQVDGEAFSPAVVAVGKILSSAARYQDEAFKKASLASLQKSKV